MSLNAWDYTQLHRTTIAIYWSILYIRVQQSLICSRYRWFWMCGTMYSSTEPTCLKFCYHIFINAWDLVSMLKQDHFVKPAIVLYIWDCWQQIWNILAPNLLYCLQWSMTALKYHQLRARRALSIFKDVPLRTRRALLLYEGFGNSALLVLNRTS